VNFANYFPNIYDIPFVPNGRGADTLGATYEMVNGVLGAHTLQIPGGTFTKLHRHGPGAHVLWLKGDGYSIMWPDGGEWVREEWGPGTMYVPPSGWWHQHAVVSKDPAVHLALKLSARTNKINTLSTKTVLSVKKGGSQMDFDDLPKETLDKLLEVFVEQCTKRGTPMRMTPILGG
jgi:hypothetical protein